MRNIEQLVSDSRKIFHKLHKSQANNDYIYVCFSVLTKSSLEEVENTPLADRSNPSDTGCPFDFGGSSLDSHWVYLIRH